MPQLDFLCLSLFPFPFYFPSPHLFRFFSSSAIFVMFISILILLLDFFSHVAFVSSPSICPHLYLPVHLSLPSAVHSLSSVPMQQPQQQPSRREGVVTLPSHRPLERTRSEPPPYSHPPLTLHASHTHTHSHSHTQHHLTQQYHKSSLERFKHNAHLSKVRGGRHRHTHVTHEYKKWLALILTVVGLHEIDDYM